MDENAVAEEETETGNKAKKAKEAKEGDEAWNRPWGSSVVFL